MVLQLAPLVAPFASAVVRKIGVKSVKELMKKGKPLLSALDPEEIVSIAQEYISPEYDNINSYDIKDFKEIDPQIKKFIKELDKEKPKLPSMYTKIDKGSKKKKLPSPYTKVYAYGGRVAKYKKDKVGR